MVKIRREIRSRTFIGQRISIDGRSFRACSFADCVFLFTGKTQPTFDASCQFENVCFELTDAAEAVVLFLQQLKSDGFGMIAQSLVEAARPPANEDQAL